MTSATKIMGQAWVEAIKEPQFDLDENARQLRVLNNEKELRADEISAELRNDISIGIQSCISRGSNSLGIEVSAEILGTRAFDNLREWAQDQQLGLVVERLYVQEGRIFANMLVMPVA